MRKSISLALVIALSLLPVSRVQANPAILAPAALCAGTAGLGCVVIGVTVIGGVTYYVWKDPNGKIVRADKSGNVQPLKSESGINGIQAAKQGEAHWVKSPDRCDRPHFKQGRALKVSPPPKATGGGYWCIY